MAINIQKTKHTEKTIDIKVKPITVGFIQKIQRLGLDKKLQKGDISAVKVLISDLTDLTEEDYESLSIEDLTELINYITKELNSFQENQKKIVQKQTLSS